MSDDSYAERRLEMFWHMPLGSARNIPNWLFLDGMEMLQIQSEVDMLQQEQFDREVNDGRNH